MNTDCPKVAPNSDNHWLVRPGTITLLWRVGYGILALTVLAQLIWPIKGHFGIDGWFAFPAIYGFLSCAAMVFGARYLGFVLKRKDDFYDG